MKKMLILFFIMESLWAAPKKGFYNDSERGWYWYEEKPKNPKEEKQEKKKTLQGKKTIAPSPREILKQQGKHWENALATAVLKPTDENIKNYLHQTTQITAQAQRFSKRFAETLWVNPKYDYSIEHPINTHTNMSKNYKDYNDREKKIKDIAKEKGFLFFFKSDCYYCHLFAPTLKEFSEEYGFNVLPVSIDGKGIKEYPYPNRPNSIMKQLNITTVPALFMIDPNKNQMMPISYGVNSWADLKRKLLSAEEKMRSL